MRHFTKIQLGIQANLSALSVVQVHDERVEFPAGAPEHIQQVCGVTFLRRFPPGKSCR
jgi:hypothetical protein